MTECDRHLHPRDGGPAKKAFRSRGAAERSIQTIRTHGERRPSGKKPRRAYLCKGCKRWFQTSDEDQRSDHDR